MTVSSATSRNDYTGNGAVDTYAYGFKIFANTDLLVTVRDTDGDETTLTLTTHYTVTGVGAANGGNVAMVNGAFDWLDGDGDLKTNYHLTIRRRRPLTQETDIRNQGSFLPEVHENTFDKATMVDQQQQDELDRSMKMPESVLPSVFSPTLPAALADNPGAAVIVNDDGDGFAVGPTADAISAAQADADAAAASAVAAAASQTAAGLSETAAAASALAAQNAAAAVVWNDVVFITVSDSPFSVTSSHRGKMICVDASGGAVSMTLPQISGLSLASPFVVGIKKTDSSGNAVTVNRAGSDTIDGGTSKQIATADSGSSFIPDTGPSPDEWTTADFGAAAGNLTIDRFSGNNSTTGFTLSVAPGSENNTQVYVDGVYQQKDTYSVSGTTLTFSAAPPTGTDNIEVVTGTTLAIGVPGDSTVTTAKIADSNVTTAKIADANVTKGKLSSTAVNLTVATATTTYAVAASDELVLCNATGGAFTATLPTAAGITGKTYRFEKTDSSTNAVTIDGNGSETIRGATTFKLATQYDTVTIVSDGTNWQVVAHEYPKAWVTFTPTGAWSSNTTYAGMYRRIGDSVEIMVRIEVSGAPTSASLTVNLPSGVVVDEAKFPAISGSAYDPLGMAIILDTATYHAGYVMYNETQTHVSVMALQQLSTDDVQLAAVTQAAPFTFAAGDSITMKFSFPVVNWEG